MNNSLSLDHLTGQEIAIVGMAGRFPGARNVEEFWRNLRAGVESVSTFSDEELLAAGVSHVELHGPDYVRAKGVLDDIEMFDGSFFGFNPREAEITDPQHRLFLECAWEALERAGYDTQRYGGRIGVYGGAGASSYLFSNLSTNPDIIESVGIYQTLMRNMSDHLTGHTAYKLNLKGPSVNVQTACSTSLVAVHLACQSLLSGECDMALAGGITITLPQKSGYTYQEGGILSPDGHCRPFDAQAKGTLGGNGVGIVLLKRLDDALADGDIIHAVIRGSAINNDGSRKVGYTAPSVEGQAKAIIAAHLTSEVSADDISYVEAHGTATALGDPIEVAALSQAFRASTSRSHFCALGSVKSNFGHLDAAAGVAGLIKTVLALKHRELPPTLHYTAPNPEIDFATSPFYVNHELRDWESQGDTPRRAGVSSFGIGGTNAHVVVEESPERAAAPSSREWHLLVLSGRTAAAVTAATEKLRRHLEAHPDISLADVAYTLQVGRREFAQRRAVVCRDVEDAIEALSQPGRWLEGAAITPGSSSNSGGSNSGVSGSGGSGRGVVLMYSGQGAQYVGMGRELYEREAVFRHTIDECASALQAAQGYDLRDVLYPEAGGEEAAAARLVETEVTQPALFVLEYALTRVWQAWGVRIEALMGHSVGEYVAACVAGVLSVEDAVRMVGRRGHLMQGMERGAMLAVRLSEAEVEAWLRETGHGVQSETEISEQRLWIAAVNGPQQCVLSGSERAIAEAERRLAAAGAGVRRLATSHAFHSGMMREAAQALAAEMEGVARGSINIPYISNVSGRWAQAEEVRGGAYWGRQILEAVQWWRGVEEVVESGAGVLLEVGPGESLVGVVKEAVRGRGVKVLSTLRARRRARGAGSERSAGEERGRGSAAENSEGAERGMVESLGEMWVRGVGVKWGGIYTGEARRRVELPTYEFERERYWVEARAGGAGDRRRGESEEGEERGRAERKEAEVGKWLYVPVWKRSVGRVGRSKEDGNERGAGEVEGAREAGVAEGAEGGRKWLVLREESGVSEELVARLEAGGADVISVSMGEEFRRVDDSTFVVHPGRKQEFVRLVRELTDEGWRPQQIVHLWNVSEGQSEITVDGKERDGQASVRKQIEQFEAAQEQSFYSLIYLAHAWGGQPSGEPISLSVVTSDAQRVTGLEGLQPEKATALGPCMVIGQEYPHITCRSIDIELPLREGRVKQSSVVKQLATELESKAPSISVAYRGYDRWVQTYERVQLDERDRAQMPVRLREGGVYLITGGLGGVGLTLAEQLVRSARAKLVLTGRAAFPARMEWREWIETHGEDDPVSLKIRKLESLEAQGANILPVQADVSDFAQMEAAIGQAEARFGMLNGVIHAAGVVGEQSFRAISETGREEASRQFVPKAHGLIVLETLLAGRELDFCLLVSSLSAVLGGLGFAAYAAANIFMDAFVQKHNERDETGWLSVNWDGWRLGREETPDEAEAEDAPLGITAEEGREVLTRLLDIERATQIIVSTGDLNARLRKWVRLEPSQPGAARGTEEDGGRMSLYPRPSLSVDFVAPRNALEQQVAEIWEDLLGVAPVGVEDDFFELGGHSLLATQVASRLRESLQLEIPLRDLFEHATVAELAAGIETVQREGQGQAAPPIVRVERDGHLPLSFAQQRLWFLDQLEPGSALYNLPVAVRMTGWLDIDALSRTMSEIVRRHEVLRTTFRNQNGQPVQVIGPPAPLPLELVDLSGFDAAEREAAAEQLASRERGQAFDLAEGPLLRAKLLRLAESEHVVLLVMHHVVSDAWSIGNLIREVATLYEAFRRGEPSPLPELEIQYADFAHWQRRWLRDETLDRQLAYWKQQLAGASTTLDLLPDRPRPPVQTYHGASHSFFVGEELTKGLRELSRRHDVTLFMTLLAAFDVLLYRYTGQEDILVGTTIANRNRVETEALIGFFINTLVLRSDLSGRPSFRQLLGRVREVALGAYAHQDLPFEKLVEELQLERDLSRSALFQVSFTLQNSPRSTLELSGLTLSSFGFEISSAKYDLFLEIVDGEHELTGLIEYNTDLFEAPTIARIIEHLQTILQSIVADAEQRITTLPLLTDVEQNQLLFQWNDTAASYTPERTLQQMFEEQAERSGEAVALVYEGAEVSYAELNRRANQLAHYLRARGVTVDDVVGVLMERSVEMVVALLGILKAGAAYLPLDPAYPQERLSFMVSDARLRWLISHQPVEATLQELLSTSAPINVLPLDEEWTVVAAQPDTVPDVRPAPDNLAYIIYTSGSTGRPKGVMIPHRAIGNHMQWMQDIFPLGAGDAVLQKTPFSFDASVWEFYAPLLAGARLVLARPGGHQDAEYLVEIMEREGVTRLQAVPTLLRMLVSEAGIERCERLREVFSGGEVLTRELAERVLRAHGGVKLYNLYGPTEATIDATWQEAERQLVEAGEEVGIGRGIANTQLYVLDREMAVVPVGVVGELYIGGAGLGRGYLNRAELTAEKFVPHPHSREGGERLYRTGDLVRWREGGELVYVGRADGQVKVRGFRIELGEIEAVLREHPSVRECVVVVKEDKSGDKRLVAYVASGGEEATGKLLRDYLKGRMPEYMTLTAFVMLENLPLTPNGKVDRRALPMPDSMSLVLGADFVAPRTPVEEIVAGIWSEMLGVESIGIEDNFFDLGGHSLLATQVISRVRDAFGQEVALRSLFEQPTVAGLAHSIEIAQRAGAGLSVPPLVPVSRDAELPLSFAQQRLWFLDQLETSGSFYNLPAAVRLTGQLNVAALEQTLSEIIRRHEVLRTTFVAVDGKPRQVIVPSASVVLPVFDISDLHTKEREEELRRLLSEEASRPFDLARGPLVRACLVRAGEDEHVALVTMHHIISDGWSMGIFIREVATLYKAFIAEEESPLSELPIQYADFAHWQRGWLQGEVLATQLSYWRAELADIPAVLELPTDRPRPREQSFNGAHVPVVLSEELTEELKALSRSERVTLFMTLLAGFQSLLFRHTGQGDIVVGTPIANRRYRELEDLIGFFVNTLALRANFLETLTFTKLLHRVREVTLGAFAHQDVPFEKLVEELQPERDLSRNPIFQVMFALQNAPMGTLELPGLALNPQGLDSGSTRFDIECHLWEEGKVLHGTFVYNTDLFDHATMQRMAEHFETLLHSITANPAGAITSLQLLRADEEQQLIAGWNETSQEFPQVVVHELFARQVERTPHNTAVVFGDVSLTFLELNRRSNLLAAHLQKMGIRPDAVVGVMIERSVEMLVGVLGVLKAGGAYLPLDPEYPAERLNFMLEDAGARVLLTQESLAHNTGGAAVEIIRLDAEWQDIIEQAGDFGSYEDNPRTEVTGENLAYVIYTSGSTGKPKGVAMTHRPLVNLLHWQMRRSSSAPRTLQFTSLSFDVSFQEIFSTWCAGAALVLIREEARRDAGELWEILIRERIERLFLPFVALQYLAEASEQNEEFPATLREVITAGEQLKITRHIRRLFGKLDGCTLDNQYGPSETHVASALMLEGDAASWPELPPIGKPIANAQLYLLDEQMQVVPVGVAGELYIGGAVVARGYLNRAEASAEKFLPHPFRGDGASRLYRTGDRARYLADGNIEFLGRRDQQVKVRGYRIELGEVEAALRQQEQVREAVVIISPSATGENRLVPYVLTEKDSVTTSTELRARLKELLPEYMIPSAFVMMETFPLTPSGKIDRRALQALEVELEGDGQGVMARTPVEEIVAAIWGEVLGREAVGVHDNFFDLGGHSLLATQVISRMRETFRQEISLRSLFEKPTVAELAASIALAQSEGQGLDAPPMVSVPRDAKLPLSFAQQRLWFLDQLEPGSAFYNLPTAIKLAGVLNVDALERSLNEIVRRHEVLRTTISQVDGEPQQIIRPAEPFRLPVMDLSDMPEEERVAEMMRLIREEAERPFDLMRGPLLRVGLLRLGAEEHTALLTMHHIVSDGWSTGILIREVAALYAAYCDGQPSPLAELQIQYADFAHWQRQWLQGDALEWQLNYWRQQLAGAPTELELPISKPRPSVQTFRAATQTVKLSREVSEELKALGRRTGVTLFMSLLAAFDVLLYRYGGQADLLVGTPIANRNRLETEALIGFFVNTLVLRLDLSGDPTFIEVLQRVREVSLEAYAHQDMPFEKLVEELQPDRGRNHSPLFQVMFVLQNIELETLELPGLSLSLYEQENRTAKFDLLLTMWETPDGLNGFLKYNTDIFEDSTAAKMIEHFQTLIENLLADPQQKLSNSSFLTEAETKGLTSADFPESGLSQKDFESLILQLNSSSSPN